MPALRTCRDPGAVGAATVHVSYTARTSSHIMAAAVIKGSPVTVDGGAAGDPRRSRPAMGRRQFKVGSKFQVERMPRCDSTRLVGRFEGAGLAGWS